MKSVLLLVLIGGIVGKLHKHIIDDSGLPVHVDTPTAATINLIQVQQNAPKKKSLDDLQIVKKRIPSHKEEIVKKQNIKAEKPQSEEVPFNEADVTKLLQIEESKPSQFRPAWKKRFEDSQKQLNPMQQAAKQAIEFTGRLDAKVRATMDLEPIENLQPPPYELPIKIRDFAAEAAAKKRAQQVDEPEPEAEYEPQNENEDTQDRFVKMLPDDLKERLKQIEEHFRMMEEAEENQPEEQVIHQEEQVAEEQVQQAAEEDQEGFLADIAEEQPQAEEQAQAEEQSPDNGDHEHAEALDLGLGEEGAQEETIIPMDFRLQEDEHVHLEAIGDNDGEESLHKGGEEALGDGEEKPHKEGEDAKGDGEEAPHKEGEEAIAHGGEEALPDEEQLNEDYHKNGRFFWLTEENHELTMEEFSQFLGALPTLTIENQIAAIKLALQKTTLRSNADQLHTLIDATNRKLLGLTLNQLEDICEEVTGYDRNNAFNLGSREVQSLMIRRKRKPSEEHEDEHEVQLSEPQVENEQEAEQVDVEQPVENIEEDNQQGEEPPQEQEPQQSEAEAQQEQIEEPDIQQAQDKEDEKVEQEVEQQKEEQEQEPEQEKEQEQEQEREQEQEQGPEQEQEQEQEQGPEQEQEDPQQEIDQIMKPQQRQKQQQGEQQEQQNMVKFQPRGKYQKILEDDEQEQEPFQQEEQQVSNVEAQEEQNIEEPIELQNRKFQSINIIKKEVKKPKYDYQVTEGYPSSRKSQDNNQQTEEAKNENQNSNNENNEQSAKPSEPKAKGEVEAEPKSQPDIEKVNSEPEVVVTLDPEEDETIKMSSEFESQVKGEEPELEIKEEEVDQAEPVVIADAEPEKEQHLEEQIKSPFEEDQESPEDAQQNQSKVKGSKLKESPEIMDIIDPDREKEEQYQEHPMYVDEGELEEFPLEIIPVEPKEQKQEQEDKKKEQKTKQNEEKKATPTSVKKKDPHAPVEQEEPQGDTVWEYLTHDNQDGAQEHNENVHQNGEEELAVDHEQQQQEDHQEPQEKDQEGNQEGDQENDQEVDQVEQDEQEGINDIRNELKEQGQKDEELENVIAEEAIQGDEQQEDQQIGDIHYENENDEGELVAENADTQFELNKDEQDEIEPQQDDGLDNLFKEQTIQVKSSAPSDESINKALQARTIQPKYRANIKVQDVASKRQVSPHNDQIQRTVSKREEKDIQEFLRSRGIQPVEEVADEQAEAEQAEAIEDDFSRFMSARGDQPDQPKNQNPTENERIVVQYPAKPKLPTEGDKTPVKPISGGSAQDLLRAKDIFDRPELRGEDDIFILQSLASSQQSNVRTLGDLAVTPDNIADLNRAQGMMEDNGGQLKEKTIDKNYNRWENDRFHGEREMENKALKIEKDQTLPDHEVKKYPAQKPPVPSPSRQQLLQQAEQHVDLSSVQCKDQYHGPWQRAKEFVCSSCDAKEAIILDEDSWYLVGMVQNYHKAFLPFLNEMKTILEGSIPIVSFGKDQICFAGERMNVRVNISQFLQTLNHKRYKGSQLIQMPDLLNTSYIQVRFIPNAEVQFKDLKLEASEPININLQQGLSLMAIGADLVDDTITFNYLGEFRLKQRAFGFNYENSHSPDLNKQKLELTIQLPRDQKFLMAISGKYFGQDLTTQLLNYLQMRNNLTGQQLRGASKVFKLIISLDTGTKEFDVNFRLKEQ